MALDEIGIHRHRPLEFGGRLLRLGQRESLRHAQMRFGHIGIDLQSVLIARDGFRIVVFLRQQVAPCHKCFSVARVALGCDFQNIIGIVEVLGHPHGAGNPEQIIRRPADSVEEILDELVVYGFGFAAFAAVIQHRGFLVLCGNADARGIQNRIQVGERAIVISDEMIDTSCGKPDRSSVRLRHRPGFELISRLGVFA